LASRYQYRGEYYYYLPYWFKVEEGGGAEVLTFDQLDQGMKDAMNDERRIAYTHGKD
jgi:hypothetical protein